MIAFNVFLNGTKLCTAGVGDDGVLTTEITWYRRIGERTKPNIPEEQLMMNVGGIDGPAAEYVRWQDEKILRVGDEIRIEIIDTNSVDLPPMRKPIDEKR